MCHELSHAFGGSENAERDRTRPDEEKYDLNFDAVSVEDISETFLNLVVYWKVTNTLFFGKSVKHKDIFPGALWKHKDSLVRREIVPEAMGGCY